ncbi:Endoplasmic reticulum aminopeptidase 1, partial [Armadillidium nasatum]
GSPHESGFLVNKRAIYEPGSVMVCSQKRACCAVSCGFLAIIAVAVIVAFTKPGCPEARYTGEPIGGYGGGRKVIYVKPLLATNGEVFPWKDIKLPPYVHPLYYSLYLHPNFTSNFVRGNVTIMITAVEETQFIVLHSRGLNISHYTLEDKYKQRIDILKFLLCLEHQQIYLGLSRILHRGSNYTINLIYETIFKEHLDGFYMSSYKDEYGNLRYIGSTHFEPTSARSAFPCFDEPHMKARFQLEIVRDESQLSLFNMPIRSSAPIPNSYLVVDEFEETVEMSTYLVAFVICDFVNVTDYMENGVRVSIWAPYTMISQADYALQVSMKIIEYYEDFFGVTYPLPKQDLIAIPNFAAGAMENWGLITYRDTSLMVDSEHTSSRAQQQVTMVIAHELAHQWFGNLVTMSWWQDLWLNEGFASYMENMGTSIAETSWAMSEQFIIEKVQPALALDGLMTSHPVSLPVHDPADIESIFDAISYKKGASIISMLEVCVGKPVLQSGLRYYLNQHRYSNAGTDDLWEALTQAAYEAQTPLNVKFQANQSDPNSPLNSTIGYRWHVPLTFISSENPVNVTTVWMNVTNIEFNIPKDLTWIKFNVGHRGIYRVNYDGAGWEMLTNLLLNDPLRISAADRASILDDVFTLVRAGRIKAKVALDLSQYLKNETAYAPWRTASTHLMDWVELLFSHPSHSLMISYVHSLVRPHYRRLGWEDTGTHLEKLLRSELLMLAVDALDTEAIKISRDMFLGWRYRNETIPPNFRHVVYSTGVRHGMEDDWWFCWRVYNSSTVPSEKKLLLRALAQTRDYWVIQQYLENTLDGIKIRSQDMLTVLAEVEEFFRDKDVGSGTRSLQQALEIIRLNIQWLEFNLEDATTWLEKQEFFKEKLHISIFDYFDNI